MIATELREGMKVQTADGPLTVKSSKPGPKGLQRVASPKPFVFAGWILTSRCCEI